MSLTTDQARTVAGAGGNVLSTGGEKIGSIGQIYLDDSTGEPTWVTVKTGLFGLKESFVPLEGANVSGDDVTVGYDKALITDAPKVDPDGSLSPAEEDQLYDYYGLGSGLGTSGTGEAGLTGTSTTGTSTTTTTDTAAGTDSAVGTGYVENGADADYSDTVTSTTGQGMDRPEDSARVGDPDSGPGRARLRRYVVTEDVSRDDSTTADRL